MDEYEQQAKQFLRHANATMEIKYNKVVFGFPFKKNDYRPRDKYTIKITRKGQSYIFPFFGSVFQHEKNIKVSEYDVLVALQKYDVGTLEEFCAGYCGELNNSDERIWAKKTYYAVCKEYQNIVRLFGDDEELMAELREIN